MDLKSWLWFSASRAPMSLDVVSFLLLLALPVQLLSWFIVRKHRKYKAHMLIQSVTGTIVGIAVIAFELEIRIFGWRHLAEESPYYDTWVLPSLILHLLFAIPALLLWIIAIYGAFKNYGPSPKPSKYSIIHKRIGRYAMISMMGTGVTGWLFYWLAFIASKNGQT